MGCGSSNQWGFVFIWVYIFITLQKIVEKNELLNVSGQMKRTWQPGYNPNCPTVDKLAKGLRGKIFKTKRQKRSEVQKLQKPLDPFPQLPKIIQDYSQKINFENEYKTRQERLRLGCLKFPEKISLQTELRNDDGLENWNHLDFDGFKCAHFWRILLSIYFLHIQSFTTKM